MSATIATIARLFSSVKSVKLKPSRPFKKLCEAKLFKTEPTPFAAKIPKTEPFALSADEGADVGRDGETNVSNDYREGDNNFTGKIHKIVVEQKK